MVAQINSNTTALATLQTALIAATGDIVPLREALTTAESTITALQAVQTTTANTLTVLQTAQTTTANDVATLQTAQTATSSALSALQSVQTTSTTTIADLQSTVATVQANRALALDPYIQIETTPINGLLGPHVIFTGANVHIRSGGGTTEDNGTASGVGNLVVGYNEPPGTRSGCANGNQAAVCTT